MISKLYTDKTFNYTLLEREDGKCAIFKFEPDGYIHEGVRVGKYLEKAHALLNLQQEAKRKHWVCLSTLQVLGN